MARTPEGKVKDTVTKQLRAIGTYYFFPQMGGFGKAGVPDTVGCYRGMFFGIEYKAGNNKPTALQRSNLEDIGDNGGFALVVNERNASDVTELLENAYLDWRERNEQGKV